MVTLSWLALALYIASHAACLIVLLHLLNTVVKRVLAEFEFEQYLMTTVSKLINKSASVFTVQITDPLVPILAKCFLQPLAER
jgi:hypothetical protein